MKVTQFRQSRDVDLGLGSDFMPYRLQSHPNDRVEVLELRVSDVDIL